MEVGRCSVRATTQVASEDWIDGHPGRTSSDLRCFFSDGKMRLEVGLAAMTAE